MVGFAMMWNWYNTNNTMTFANYEDQGEFIDIEAEHDSIYFDIPNSLSAYQIQINYQPEDVFINKGKTNQEKIYLTHEEKELGIYTIMAQPGQSKLAIPIEIRGRETNISISYKGLTMEGDLAGQMTQSITIENVPDEFVLYNNYPNPFNPTTKIDYGLPDVSNVKLVIYDIIGREVISLINQKQEAGYRSITWHGVDSFGMNVGAGMYFYVLEADNFRQVKKMVFLK